MLITKPIVKTNWFDLPAANVMDARMFYEGLFEWEFLLLQDASISDYWVIQSGQELIGGLRKVPSIDRNANTTVLYFSVDDLDRYTARVKELGGMIVGERVDLGKGRGSYQWFRDREGNLVALWAA